METAEYRQPYPTWILMGMDLLAAGILIASFRDAWSVVSSLGVPSEADSWSNAVVAGAVVLAMDAAILLLEQTRSQVKLRGGNTLYNDIWVIVLICISAMLNVRYLTTAGELTDRIIGAVLGVAIPSTIAVLGYLKGDMLAYNARCRFAPTLSVREGESDDSGPHVLPMTKEETPAPLFRIKAG